MPAALLQQFTLLLCRKAIETRAKIAQQGECVPQLPFRGNITDGRGGSFPAAFPLGSSSLWWRLSAMLVPSAGSTKGKSRPSTSLSNRRPSNNVSIARTAFAVLSGLATIPTPR